MKEATVDVTVMLDTKNMTKATVFLMIKEVFHLTQKMNLTINGQDMVISKPPEWLQGYER